MNFRRFFEIIIGLKRILRALTYTFLCFLSILFLGACSVTDHLQEGEYLLYSQRIKGTEEVSREALAELYKQRPNRKILGFMPYVHIYYLGKKFYDSTEVVQEIKETKVKYNQRIQAAENEKKKEKLQEKKENKLEKLDRKLREGNWLMRAPGEPPSLYDSSLTSVTEKQMTFYVRSKGFFRGEVKAKVDTTEKFVRVTYAVREGKPYIIENITYTSVPGKNYIEDQSIDSLIKVNQDEALLQEGERYEEQNLTAERERLYQLLKNNGYYDFNRQYIFYNIDTTKKSGKVFINLIISDPGRGLKHKKYTISNVVFDTDISTIGAESDTVSYNGVEYIFGDREYSTRILDNKIKLQPGKLYSQRDIQISQRQLASLDMYKFININFEKNQNDTIENSLTAYIRTSPLKKYQITDEIGINVAQGFVPGPFLNLSFKDRNIFGGFEIFEINLKAAIEGYASFSDPDKVLQTQEFSSNFSLAFPELLFPVGKVRDLFRDDAPRTRLLTGATLIKRPEYDRLNLKTSINYSILRNLYSSYNISLIDINVINTIRTDTIFERYLDTLAKAGNNLRFSFNKAFVTSTNFSYTYNNNEFGQNKRSKYFKLFLESGGFWPSLLSQNDSLLNLQIFRFVKANADLRYYFPVRAKSTFAMRFNFGIAYPYGEQNALPYEKYFFAGGSNSIRAWRPRRLGPGSYFDPLRGNQIEQPGELLFETSYEYRFNIFSFFDGAVFVDAGNIWSITEDANRPGSSFQPNSFFKEIGVGTGFGLRLNFSFLILRFDVGIKAYDPAEAEGEKFVLPRLLENPPFGRDNQTIINIGIGYPF